MKLRDIDLRVERAKNTLGRALSGARKAQGLNQPMLRQKLEQRGVSVQTSAISKWQQQRQRQPCRIPTSFSSSAIFWALTK